MQGMCAGICALHIEYATYKFFRKIEGGRGNSPPPLVLTLLKKRGPERVKPLDLKIQIRTKNSVFNQQAQLIV